MTLPGDPFDRYDDPAIPMIAMVHIATNLMDREMRNPHEPEAMDFLTDKGDDIVFAALNPQTDGAVNVNGKDIALTQATIEDLALAVIDRLYDGRWTILLTADDRTVSTNKEFSSAFDAGRWGADQLGSTTSVPMPVEIVSEAQLDPDFTMKEMVVDGYVLVEVAGAPVVKEAITESLPVIDQK